MTFQSLFVSCNGMGKLSYLCIVKNELFITQSTLSQQILHLEQELSQQLFVRNSHEVILTEAGEMLLPMARDSVYMVDNCVQRIQELGQLLTGELNIGVTFSFSGSGSTVADGAEGFKNEMEGCIHTLKNGSQKASAREFIHMLHQSTAIWKTMGE